MVDRSRAPTRAGTSALSDLAGNACRFDCAEGRSQVQALSLLARSFRASVRSTPVALPYLKLRRMPVAAPPPRAARASPPPSPRAPGPPPPSSPPSPPLAPDHQREHRAQPPELMSSVTPPAGYRPRGTATRPSVIPVPGLPSHPVTRLGTRPRAAGHRGTGWGP